MTTTGLATPSDRVLVLFGATGDLAGRKLLPGLFHLYRVGLMPDRFRIIGPLRNDDDWYKAFKIAAGKYYLKAEARTRIW